MMSDYINALMQVERPEDREEKFWFPSPGNLGNEDEHSSTQKRILKELQELSEREKFDPRKKKTLETSCFQCSTGLTH